MRWTAFAAKEARLTLAAWEARVGPLKPPIAVENLADLLYLLAIDVTFELPRTLAGRLYAEQRIIEVRRGDSPRRQRFTIAHEVGHYRLHVVAKGAQDTYACSATMIALGDGEGQTPKILRETPLPGFVAPDPPTAPAPSVRDIRRLEIEANAFAAELLIPAPLVEQAVARYGKDVRALAEIFDVSQQAMQIRLEKLLLIPRPGPQTSFLGEL
ncbi:MAG: ImmA/IrrE family metallo-endopeptidase [Oscillochloris sp.]|nr:ImmA/IrrE family metallo-endopeptidase [Oscillochloris sp.]